MNRYRRDPHALIRCWREPDKPLPVRILRGLRPPSGTAWFEHDSRSRSDAHSSGPFDFCAGIQRLIMDISARLEAFRHLQAPRILVSVSQARRAVIHGVQARITPLRFRGGALTRQRRGVMYQVQRYFLGDHEFLYLLTFSLPRFLDRDFDQKMVTLFHELHHINPTFDGDLRRHQGRYQFHTHSQREYDDHMVDHARAYLATKPDPRLHGFLRMSFAQLQERHGAITGIMVPRPQVIPLISARLPY